MGLDHPKPLMTRLTQHGLVIRTNHENLDHWSFSSELVRESAERGILGIQKRKYHGPIAEAMREGQAVIEDPEQTASWVVSLPEVLPVSESLELIEGLRADRIPVGGVLVNKVLDDAFDAEERAAIDKLLDGQNVFGMARYGSVAQCRESMERLKSEGRVTLVAVPEFPDVGPDLMDHVVTSLLEPEVHRC